jgi:hypothetical protein
MKIKIIGCSNPARWYINSIGKTFEICSIIYNIDLFGNKKIIKARIVQSSPDYELYVEGEDLEIIEDENNENKNKLLLNKLNKCKMYPYEHWSCKEGKYNNLIDLMIEFISENIKE